MPVFDDIYESNAWGVGSGLGSLPRVTERYRSLLQDLLTRQDITSVLDFGCGDWQFSRLIDWTGIDYLGIDVVEGVIERNRAAHGSDGVRFQVASADMSGVPSADMIIVKDVLQHLSNDDVHRFVENVLPRFSYALVTNCVRPFWRVNADVPPGGFRPVDLGRPPFLIRGERLLDFHGPWHFSRGRVRRWRKHTTLVRPGA